MGLIPNPLIESISTKIKTTQVSLKEPAFDVSPIEADLRKKSLFSHFRYKSGYSFLIRQMQNVLFSSKFQHRLIANFLHASIMKSHLTLTIGSHKVAVQILFQILFQ